MFPLAPVGISHSPAGRTKSSTHQLVKKKQNNREFSFILFHCCQPSTVSKLPLLADNNEKPFLQNGKIHSIKYQHCVSYIIRFADKKVLRKEFLQDNFLFYFIPKNEGILLGCLHEVVWTLMTCTWGACSPTDMTLKDTQGRSPADKTYFFSLTCLLKRCGCNQKDVVQHRRLSTKILFIFHFSFFI